jgi:hypothetical protein
MGFVAVAVDDHDVVGIDSFVYEPVIVGSLEDAFCAAMLNPDLAAVVINDERSASAASYFVRSPS